MGATSAHPRALGGQWPAALMRAAISLALLSSVSSMIVAGPRVYARMARDGVFPALFRGPGEGGEDRAPTASIALQVLLAVLVVSVSTLSQLLSYLGFTLSLSAAATVTCLFLVRRREGASNVPCAGYPWVPGFFVLTTVVLAGRRGPPALGAGRGGRHHRQRRRRVSTPGQGRAISSEEIPKLTAWHCIRL